jgi:hypothetical protein
MIPTISLSDKGKTDWLEARDAALSPNAFFAETRLRLLNESVPQMKSVHAVLTAHKRMQTSQLTCALAGVRSSQSTCAEFA